MKPLMDGYADPRSLVAAVLRPAIRTVTTLTDKTLRKLPVAHLVHVTGRVGAYDRVDEVRVDVYDQPAEGAPLAADRLLARLLDVVHDPDYHDSAAGFIDRIDVGVLEEPAPGVALPGPYTLASLTLMVTHRPQ